MRHPRLTSIATPTTNNIAIATLEQSTAASPAREPEPISTVSRPVVIGEEELQEAERHREAEERDARDLERDVRLRRAEEHEQRRHDQAIHGRVRARRSTTSKSAAPTRLRTIETNWKGR